MPVGAVSEPAGVDNVLLRTNESCMHHLNADVCPILAFFGVFAAASARRGVSGGSTPCSASLRRRSLGVSGRGVSPPPLPL